MPQRARLRRRRSAVCLTRLQEPQMTHRILFVLTRHDRKGPAGTADAALSGSYLSEVTHPHRVLAEKRA